MVRGPGRPGDASGPTYRSTRLVHAAGAMGPARGERRVNLWRVVDRASGQTVFGPDSWQGCCAFKQGLPGGRRGPARRVETGGQG